MFALKKEEVLPGKCCIKREEFQTEFNCCFSKRSKNTGGSFSPNLSAKLLLAIYKIRVKCKRKTEGLFHTEVHSYFSKGI